MPQYCDVSDYHLRSWRARGYTVEAVHKLTKIPLEVLRERYHALYCSERADDPTQQEIRERCAAIQAGWTPAERWQRQVTKSGRWTPIVVPASVLTSVSSSADGFTEWSGHTPHFATSSESTETRRGLAG